MGDFEPCSYRSRDVEISLKEASKYTLDAAYYRKKDKTVIAILRGKIEVDGIAYEKGDVLEFAPGE